MIHWRSGVVTEITRARPGVAEMRVQVHAELLPALALTELVGTPEAGDRVLLNTSALRRGLGTGGHAQVVAIPDRLPPDPAEGPGHIVKARYTPLQTMVLAVEEQESPEHELLSSHPGAVAGDLAGLPVVVAELHSALPAVIAGARSLDPDLRVGYVMTDAASLPLALSETVAGLREAGWLATTTTSGQAFGGEREAVTVHSALLAARWVDEVDLLVVAQGPGAAGSGTPWGHSGLAAGEALTAAHTLRGRPVAALRVSGADERERHRGLSHHATTSLARVALGEIDLPVPRAIPADPDLGRLLPRQVASLCADATASLHLREVAVEGLEEALDASPVPLTTMGRDRHADPAPFVTAAAAGRWAASLSRP